mgnify:CR=1 FL=1
MSGKYDDILTCPPTSAKHLGCRFRAGRHFQPFAALSGHAGAVAETARLTDQRMDLDEDTRAELDRRQAVLLKYIAEQPEVTVIWFQPDERKDGGSYVTTVGRAKKIDEFKRILSMVGGQEIVLDDIVQIESQLLYDLPN